MPETNAAPNARMSDPLTEIEERSRGTALSYDVAWLLRELRAERQQREQVGEALHRKNGELLLATEQLDAERQRADRLNRCHNAMACGDPSTCQDDPCNCSRLWSECDSLRQQLATAEEDTAKRIARDQVQKVLHAVARLTEADLDDRHTVVMRPIPNSVIIDAREAAGASREPESTDSEMLEFLESRLSDTEGLAELKWWIDTKKQPLRSFVRFLMKQGADLLAARLDAVTHAENCNVKRLRDQDVERNCGTATGAEKEG